jgi:uncharacterized protein
VRDGVLLARVSAPPVDGGANTALIRLLARELDVPAGSVGIAGGQTGRTKRIVVEGVTAAFVRARWPDLTV